MKSYYSEWVTEVLNLFFLVELLQHAQQIIRSDLLANVKDDDIKVTGHLLKAHNYNDDAIKTLHNKGK